MQKSPPEVAHAADEVARLRERIRELEQQLNSGASPSSGDSDTQRRTREALEFLADASAILASSLDYEETLSHLARVTVPHIADWCAIDLRAKEGGI